MEYWGAKNTCVVKFCRFSILDVLFQRLDTLSGDPFPAKTAQDQDDDDVPALEDNDNAKNPKETSESTR